ncbi:MAG: hypothetical protein A2283_13700 [Lentisphaerae bacterium RIFOXYA12_FULL_48_11]|nr:MAG: hypothetical protein A2283_13700 [Lentisphaerae bacterium RIFOXYA12_FULL_48_11]
MSTSPLCLDSYVIPNVEGDCFLDVGCGYGKWGFLLKKYRGVDSGRTCHIAGIDIFAPHVESLRRQGIYDELVVGDATRLPYADQSFDSVLACDVLEHLEKEQGMRMMQELKRVARICVIVSTPNFECLRLGAQTQDGFNEYEAHKSVWTYPGFCSLGFTTVIGVGGLQIPSWRLSMLLSSLGRIWPSRSRLLIGFWYADGKKRILCPE